MLQSGDISTDMQQRFQPLKRINKYISQNLVGIGGIRLLIMKTNTEDHPPISTSSEKNECLGEEKMY